MKQFFAVVFCAVVLFSFTGSARAQFTASIKTNTISGVHSNWVGNGTYVVGSNTFKDVLEVISGGVLSNGSGYLGYAANSSNNAVLVTGAGSVWSNSADLTVGLSGPGNTLTISSGGAVYAGTCRTGNNLSSSSNAVTVTGTGSVWSNGSMYIALSSAGNTLTITNGGTVISDYCSVAGNPTSSNTVLKVIGTNSVWSVFNLDFGFSAPRSTLTISEGGAVYNYACRMGLNTSSSNNVITVTGTGSVFSATNLFVGYSSSSGNRLVVTNGGVVRSDFLYAGYNDSSNVLIIAGGSVIAGNAFIGFSDQLHGLTTNSVIRVDSGSLFVTNEAGNGALVVSRIDGKGNLILNGGSVAVDSLVATNGTNSVISLNGGTLTGGSVLDNDLDRVISSHFAFNTATITAHHLVITNGTMVFPSGLVQVTGTTVSNGQPFVVGNGAFGAEYHLLGGIHSFNNGLRISNAATLSGCGTVNGSVTIDSNGSVFADCGRLTFTGTVTNNWALAADGVVLEFYGTVVNNGGILLYNGGTTSFHGTFINNGIVSNAGPVIVSSVNRIGDDMVIQAPSTNGFRYQLQITTAVVSPVWTNSRIAQSGTNGVLTFTDPGGATNKPTRFYQVDVIWP